MCNDLGRIIRFFAAVVLFLNACRSDHKAPLSRRISLGEKLFYSTILSDDGSVSCATCHQAGRAFSDGLQRSAGLGGRLAQRNAPGLFNLERRAPYLSEGGVRTLEELVIAPLHDSVEMGSNIGRVVYRLWQDTLWLHHWLSVWDSLPSPHTVTKCLADYLRTLKSESSRADRYYRGNTTLLSAQELAGARIFTRPDVGCARCHHGPDLTDNQFHNVGVAPHSKDQGRYRLSFEPRDFGRFKTPSLRNLRFTAPYMHDGSLPTLAEVIDHYTHSGHPFSSQDEITKPIVLNPEEKKCLEAFLLIFTDSDFIEVRRRRERLVGLAP